MRLLRLRMTPTDSRLLRLWDRMVIPATRRVELHWTPPFGQSVFAVGRRTKYSERVSKLDRRASNTGARRLIRLGGWRLPRVVRAVTPPI